MKKRFEIGDMAYVVEYFDNEFKLYVDALASKNKQLYDRNSFDFMFGDEPPDVIFHQIASHSAFQVLSNVMVFVRGVIKSEKPYYFFFSANEDQKIDLYEKVASRIAKKYNYFIYKDGERFFRFYRK